MTQQESIHDMVKTKQLNEYAFALGRKKGLVFATIVKQGLIRYVERTDFKLRQNYEETYFVGKSV